jgi:NAD(P)H-flavin reductase
MANVSTSKAVVEKESGYSLNEIVVRRDLAPSITLFKLYTPDIAAKVKPGQFVVLRSDGRSERLPLTVADFDRRRA